MIVSQLLTPEDLLALSETQLDSLEIILQTEIVKSEDCMKLLKRKLDQEYLPAIRSAGHPTPPKE